MVSRIPRYLLLLSTVLLPPGVWAAELAYTVEGLDGPPEDNVNAYLSGPDTVASERGARGMIPSAVEKARSALQALGYYDPSIETSLSGNQESGWEMTLNINAGKPVRLRHVRIKVNGEASDDPVFKQLLAQLPLHEGDVLNHGEYASAKNALQSQALSRGYFDYAFSASRIDVNTDALWADVHLVMESGPRYSLGPVSFTESPFRDDLIERFVPYDAPTPYSADVVADLNRDLLDSGYFSNVRVNLQREQAKNRTIPVQVDLDARDPNTIGVGAGFSTDEGPRIRFSWDRHWVNDRGHQLFNELRLSGVRQNASTRYVIPLDDPLNDRLEFQAGLQAEDFEDTHSRRATVGVQRQQNFDSGWRRVQSLRYLQERFDQADQEGNTGLLLPGITFSRTRARGQPDPYWGDSQSYALEAGNEYLLSDINLARLVISNKWLRTVGSGHRFYLKLDAGGMATSSFEDVPPSLRFFAGGDNSVRGYSYNSLAPENEDGELLGGRYLLTGSVEYSYPVVPKWRLALFTDAGNAFDDFSNPDYKVGSGFGVRWASPVGPVRLDFAWGVSEDKVPFQLHFSLGPPF